MHSWACLMIKTKVDSVDYQTYEDLKRKGKIEKEERRGNVVYFAVTSGLDVRMSAAGPGEAISAWVIVTERYKTVIPK